MSKILASNVSDLSRRLTSGIASAVEETLDEAHSRLNAASQASHRYKRLRHINEQSLRALASSVGLECWSDDTHGSTEVISITGKIIVVDITFDATTHEVQSCTLVLASEDGMQEEITYLVGNQMMINY